MTHLKEKPTFAATWKNWDSYRTYDEYLAEASFLDQLQSPAAGT
jgi:hypothetical protein